MHSPAELAFEKANTKIESQRIAKEKREEKAAITDNVDQALNFLGKNTVLSDYTANGQEKLDVSIKRDTHGAVANSRGTHTIEISGTLTDLGSGNSAVLPMYRILRKIPNSDTMGNLPGGYEISVADPTAETGYTTLALVKPVPRDSAPYIDGFDFGSESNPTPAEVEALVSEGYYKSPHSEAMLEEVQSILGMAITQQMEIQVAADPVVTV